MNDSLGDMLVQVTEVKKAQAGPEKGETISRRICQLWVPGQRELEKGVKVKREGLKTVYPIRQFLSKRLEG